MPRGSRIRDRAIITPEKATDSTSAREIASNGSRDSTASKKPVDIHQGGTKTRKKSVPRIKRGFKRLIIIAKIPQKKVDKKSRITILPLEGRMEGKKEWAHE
jgi:hypothetical protein